MDIEQLRLDTPGCSERIHLNNSGASLMPLPVIEAIQDHISLEARVGGYEAADMRLSNIEDAYRSVANLLKAKPRNIAFTENATVSFSQAVSSIPFKAGDIILTTRNDYASNQIQFLSLKERLGVEFVRAPDQEEGGVDVHAMADLIRKHHPRLVCVTHIPTNSGLVQDVASIGAVCKEEGILYLVDACQSVGQVPLDMNAIGCDFLSASSRKFLRGPRGAGFLYVSDNVLEEELTPLFLDMRGADWIEADRFELLPGARRFENFEFSWALVLGTGAAARYALSVGMDQIQARVYTLAAQVRESLKAIDRITVMDKGKEQCGIVSSAIEGMEPQTLMDALRERGINVSAQNRVSAVIDNKDKGISASLRIAPHYFNTEEEIEEAVGAIREVVQHPSE